MISQRNFRAGLIAVVVITLAVGVGPRAWGDDSGGGPVLRSADGQLQLALPAHWDSHDFHLDAVKIGASRGKEAYVEIIADPRDQYVNDLKQYADAKLETMVVLLEKAKVTTDGPMDITGRHAMRFEIEGTLPDSGAKIGYVLTVIETRGNYIQVISWRGEKTFAEHLAELQGLAAGFEDLGEKN